MKFYCYEKCSTCRKALGWLERHGIEPEVLAIRETPPAEEELAAMLAAQGGNVRKLFNTSGMDYRALGLKDQLPHLTPSDAFKILRSNGMLVKRPFLIGVGVHLLGFREAEWNTVFGPTQLE